MKYTVEEGPPVDGLNTFLTSQEVSGWRRLQTVSRGILGGGGGGLCPPGDFYHLGLGF